MEFYKALAGNSADAKTRDLCIRLSVSEINHKKMLKDWLSEWLPAPIPTEKMINLLSEAKKSGVFLNAPGKDSSEEDMVKFALFQENKMEKFYRSFEGASPDAWEKMQIQKLAIEERSQARSILDSYPDLKLS